MSRKPPTPDETGEAPLDSCRWLGSSGMTKRDACALCTEHATCTRATKHAGRVKPYLDCPTCPYCGGATGIGGPNYDLSFPMLVCAACGRDWHGTPEQVAQAKRADAAWEKRENGERGPRSRFVRRRAKRPTNQLSIFDQLEEKETAT